MLEIKQSIVADFWPEGCPGVPPSCTSWGRPPVRNATAPSADWQHKSILCAASVDVVVALPTGTADAAAWKAGKGVPFDVVTGRTGTAHEEAGQPATLVERVP